MKQSLLSLVLALSLVQSACASNFATKVMNATFKLFNPSSTSTCFLLSKEGEKASYYLVTTAHSLERAKGDTAALVLRKAKDDGGYARLDFKVQIRKDNRPLWIKHKTQDVAVLKLSRPLPVPVAALPLTALANDERLKTSGVHVCSQLFAFTYPSRLEANPAGFPIARQGIFSSSPLLTSDKQPTFLADLSSFSGDSGGPVFVTTENNKTPLIVGIVLGRFFSDEKIKSEYEERHIRHPLGLGLILHARYVRETLDLVMASK